MSNKKKLYIVDLLEFNSFALPCYATSWWLQGRDLVHDTRSASKRAVEDYSFTSMGQQCQGCSAQPHCCLASAGDAHVHGVLAADNGPWTSLCLEAA